MKSKILMCSTAAALVALAMPMQFRAQDAHNCKKEPPKYKLIDVESFGGPQSFYFSATVVESVNNHGTVRGAADTPASRGRSPDGHVIHAFRSHHGILPNETTGVPTKPAPNGLPSEAATVSMGTLVTGEQMSVSICNLGELSESVLARAKKETAAIFRRVDVLIQWKHCDEGPPGGQADTGWFTIRLRSANPPEMAGDSSREAMGRAFLSDRGDGYMGDAYLKQIEDLARPYQADAASLLGQVVAHELGHLLLGPGHSRNSIMRAEWMVNKLAGMHQQWLQFTDTQARQIRHKLRTRPT